LKKKRQWGAAGVGPKDPLKGLFSFGPNDTGGRRCHHENEARLRGRGECPKSRLDFLRDRGSSRGERQRRRQAAVRDKKYRGRQSDLAAPCVRVVLGTQGAARPTHPRVSSQPPAEMFRRVGNVSPRTLRITGGRANNSIVVYSKTRGGYFGGRRRGARYADVSIGHQLQVSIDANGRRKKFTA